MADILFVADRPVHPLTMGRIWVAPAPKLYYFNVNGENLLISFLSACRVGEGGQIEVTMSADIPAIDPDNPVTLSSLGSSHDDSDPFAAVRAMSLLLGLPTSPSDVLADDYVKMAYSAARRRVPNRRLPSSINEESKIIIKAVREEFYAEVMSQTIGNINDLIETLVRGRRAWISRESFEREVESQFLPHSVLDACGPFLTESGQLHHDGTCTLGLFSPQDYIDLGAAAAIAADRRLRGGES